MSDIFREVDEDVRHDRLVGLWQQYGPYLISIVVAIILGVAGRAFWNNYTLEKQTSESVKYDQAIALMMEGDSLGSIVALEGISNDTSSGYGHLALFQAASQYIESGDKASALALYDNLRDDSGVDDKFQGLATLLGAIVALDIESSDAAKARLLPLAVYGESWYFSAQEFLALLALRSGQLEEAISIYSGLVNDQTTPADIRQRASEILSVVEVENSIIENDATPEANQGITQ